MRTEAEIERVHDLIVGILLDECPAMAGRADVLCWVLQHDHNVSFGKLLAQFERTARAAGIILEHKGN